MMMMMGFWLIAPLLFLIGVVAYALGWRPQSSQMGPAETGQTATEILKARYASGDITRDEYEQLHRDLEA